MKRKQEVLKQLDIPADIAIPAFRVAENRIAGFVAEYELRQRWPYREQSTEMGMNLIDLCRAVYLQGLWDGVQVAPRVADLGPPNGLLDFLE